MIGIDGETIGDLWALAAARWPMADFLVEPHPEGGAPKTWTYADAAEDIDALKARFSMAGYGHGHRIALLMGNRAEFFLIKLAANALGISLVPVNPDYRPAEVAYLLEDSGAHLAIAESHRIALMREGAEIATQAPAIVEFAMEGALPPAPRPSPSAGAATPETEASLIYTSGTTGRPKGCLISHEAELMYGAAYLLAGPPVGLRECGDRILNPLPLFHVNAGIITFFGVVLSGNAQIIPERFSASTWWRDIRATRATIFHYLGVVISVLMADKTATREDLGDIRVGFGAGVEPALHAAFEDRFGVPLVECWGMTEMCRVLTVAEEPRMIDTRAMGRPRDDLEVKVVDENDVEVPRGTPGEMVLRHSLQTPRKGFFSGYLNKPEATAEAWRGGWFHTGDTVTMDETDMVFFVDRKKNIIRRAGENIAAAEVENCLFEDDRVASVACLAVPDDIREEEVMACVVLSDGVAATKKTAEEIFARAFERLAYFKPPGWIRFMDALPVTGTQKVVKHAILADGEDPFAEAFDLRTLKKRR
ncbi:MAG: AMP-binding protein [Pseudomonadota bacterium]